MKLARALWLGMIMVCSLVAMPSAEAAQSCSALLNQTQGATDRAAKTWNAFIEAFNKYAFQPDYSNSDRGIDNLRAMITEIRSLQANASGYITEATSQNCKLDPFMPLQNALQDIATQLTRAEVQLRN
jgi:hypothetical protein